MYAGMAADSNNGLCRYLREENDISGEMGFCADIIITKCTIILKYNCADYLVRCRYLILCGCSAALPSLSFLAVS